MASRQNLRSAKPRIYNAAYESCRCEHSCIGDSRHSHIPRRLSICAGVTELCFTLILWLISNPEKSFASRRSASMRVDFLGLGIMGEAMATNLVKAGHEVTVWNRTPGKMVEGAGIAPNPAAAAQGAEVVWLCVSDTAAVEKILFGPEGVEQSLAEGMIIADSSTISPSATLRFAERVRARGVAYVDAPMTGSKIGAGNGTLIFMVGGDEAIIERLHPLFEAMGKKIFRMGETGKGQATKLAMNLQIALIFEGFAEALTLATKLGVDPRQLVALIEATMVRSGVVDYNAPFVLQHP